MLCKEVEMKAIETIYDDHRFRSRLEARWAVAFDEMGLDYEYEKQGFDLGGRYYLPDFHLPEPGWWVEVKGPPPDHDQQLLARLLMQETGCDSFIFHGTPVGPPLRDNILQKPEYDDFKVWAFPALGEEKHCVDGEWAIERLASLLSWLRLNIKIVPENEKQAFDAMVMKDMLKARFYAALTAGRQARFEHGQYGAPRQWT